MRMKLKETYTLIEQLYTGAQRVISAASYNKPAPTLIKDTLARLSMTPAQIEELKRSAARAGALLALTRAKPWIADLDPVDIAKGYPDEQENGSAFDNEALKALTKEMRPVASQLAEEVNLTSHWSFYDANNHRVDTAVKEVQNLILPIRKHTYAPDVEPSNLISEEAVFQALTRIDWTTVDFQPLGGEEEVEPTPEDPSTSRQPGDES